MLKKVENHGRIVMLFLMAAAITLSLQNKSVAKAQQTTYRSVTELCDWGAASTKVIVNLGKTVTQGTISNNTFTVFVTRSDARLATPLLEEGYRMVKKSYVSDEKGNAAKVGQYATLELEYGPNISLSLPINYNNESNVWIDYKYTITQIRDIGSGSDKISGLEANKSAGEIRKLLDDFSTGKATYDNITLTYADYAPEKDSKKNPLIIWLHGGGEGGTDPTVPLCANKCVNLASPKTQSYFDGAYVLVPQAETYWMQGFSADADGTSIYEKPLISFIKDYVAKNPDIDPNRIYIGGCSNGGYMTMLLIRDYPSYFAAAFPVCEGLANSLISNKDIEKMKNVPIWLVAAKTDAIFPPGNFATPTYNRLIKAGAKHAYYSLFEDVHDTSGLYNNENGTPFQYFGHFSWIYLFNNECITTINGKTVTIMEWLASMSLNKK